MDDKLKAAFCDKMLVLYITLYEKFNIFFMRGKFTMLSPFIKKQYFYGGTRQ